MAASRAQALRLVLEVCAKAKAMCNGEWHAKRIAFCGSLGTLLSLPFRSIFQKKSSMRFWFTAVSSMVASLNATEYDTIQPFYLPSYCTRPLQNCLHGRIAALCATRRLAYLIDMSCLLPCKGPNLLKKTKGFQSGY